MNELEQLRTEVIKIVEQTTEIETLKKWINENNQKRKRQHCCVETLEEKNKHERDDGIRFEEKPHKYFSTATNEEYTSVSRIISKYSTPFDADKILEKMNQWTEPHRCKGKNACTKPKCPDSKYYGMTVEEIKKIWQEKKDKSTELGKVLHNAIENYFNYLPVKTEGVEDEFKLFQLLYKELDHLEPFRTEWMVYDDKNKIAGTIDLVFRNTKTGEYVLMDWKRSEQINFTNNFENMLPPLDKYPNCNGVKYQLQLNIYKRILEENYEGIKIEKMYNVVFHGYQKNYIIHEVPIMDEDVKKLY